MDPSLQLFIGSLLLGLMLLAIEVFVPGGILGAFGAIALLVAIGAGFQAFGAQGGIMAALLVIIFSAAFLVLYLRLFPRTPMGRALTLRRDGSAFKDALAAPGIVPGASGVAQTPLRPAGIALIDGMRTDVVAESGFIDAAAAVKVVRVEGHRIVVRVVQA